MRIVNYGNTLVYIEFSGKWKYIPMNNNYRDFLDKLKTIYISKYQIVNSDVERFINLIRINNCLRGYKFDIFTNIPLYYSIWKSDYYRKRVGRKFINSFLNNLDGYHFCGISDLNSIVSDRIISTYNRDFCSIDFIWFFENFLLKVKDRLFENGFGFNYLMLYMLNLHPEKLEFLINEVK